MTSSHAEAGHVVSLLCAHQCVVFSKLSHQLLAKHIYCPWNDPYCVEWDVKPCWFQSLQRFVDPT